VTALCLPVSVAADRAVRRHWTGAAGQHRPCVCAEDGQPRCSRLLLPPQDTGSKPPRITLSVPLHSPERRHLSWCSISWSSRHLPHLIVGQTLPLRRLHSSSLFPIVFISYSSHTLQPTSPAVSCVLSHTLSLTLFVSIITYVTCEVT